MYKIFYKHKKLSIKTVGLLRLFANLKRTRTMLIDYKGGKRQLTNRM